MVSYNAFADRLAIFGESVITPDISNCLIETLSQYDRQRQVRTKPDLEVAVVPLSSDVEILIERKFFQWGQNPMREINRTALGILNRLATPKNGSMIHVVGDYEPLQNDDSRITEAYAQIDGYDLSRFKLLYVLPEFIKNRIFK